MTSELTRRFPLIRYSNQFIGTKLAQRDQSHEY